MENEPHRQEHLTKGTSFATKDVFFETVKSTAMGFAGTTGIIYGLLKLIDGAITKNWTLKPNSYDLAISSAIGAFFGINSGLQRKISTEIKNDKADFLNKYTNQPQIQNELLLRTGGPSFYYKRTHTHQAIRNISDFSLLSWVAYDLFTINQNKYPDSISLALGATTILSSFGEMGAKLFGMSQQANKEREKMSNLEKILAEKTANTAIER